jgi:hypothetical protein
MKHFSNDKEQTMLAKFTRPVLAISFLASLVAMSATANAGVTISDKRYLPSEVGFSAYRSVSKQHAPRDAFAAIGQISESSGPRYLGGPKSGSIVNQGEFAHTHPGGR